MKPAEQECAVRAVELYRAGVPVKGIALELQSSHRKVLNWLTVAGIQTTTRDMIVR